MSTTFGISRLGIFYEPIDDEIILQEDDEIVEVAFRSNRGGICWTNSIAHLLPDNTMVYPMDNGSQGIYTIGDIKNEINHESKNYIPR